jgi:site-specific DNA-methyltransferase (adenine-specific)
MSKVIQGDCLEVMKDIEDKSIDMILCDLPYNTTACRWDVLIPFEPLWEQYKRIIKDNGAIVLTASQPFTSKLVMSNIKMFKYEWVWIKPQGVDPFMSKIRPLNNIEYVLVFGKKVNYFPQKEVGKPYHIIRDKTPRIKETNNVAMKQTETKNEGDRLPIRTLYFKQEKGLHPTQKPVALFEYLIKTYTNEGDLVLDNCAGSGTTGVACKNLNRNYILIEKEPEYVEIIKKRLTK